MTSRVSSALRVYLMNANRVSSLNLQRGSNHRCFHATAAASNASNKSTTTKDSRLAGRPRFYKEVGVVSVPPPWEADDETTLSNSRESPISAGVDGSQSASGVHHLPSGGTASDSLKLILSPRRPGMVEVPDKENEGDWFGVTLDGRMLKTPMGQTLALPSQHLAYAIAGEWNAQIKFLKPSQMPLMTLACTTLDQAALHPDAYRKESLRYLPNDTTCFWADPTEDRILHRRQEQAWLDLHKFVESRFDHAPAFAMGANEGIVMARKRSPHKPTSGLPHPPSLYEKAEEWTSTLDAWHLVSLHSICAQAKSFIVALALLEKDHPESPFKTDLARAVEASRVEEEFQISTWGLVEGGHDYDRLNCSVQLHSAQLFARAILLDNNL